MKLWIAPVVQNVFLNCMASFNESIYCAPGVLCWNHLPYIFPMLQISLLCSRDSSCFHYDFSRLKLTLGSCIFNRYWNVCLLRLTLIEDVGSKLPDCARRTPSTSISSPGSPRLQAGSIVIKQAMHRQEALSLRGRISCCLSILWSRQDQHIGPSAGSSLQLGPLSQRSKMLVSYIL